DLPSDGTATLRAEAGDLAALRLIQANNIVVESRATTREYRGSLHQVPVKGAGRRPGTLFLVRRPDCPGFGPSDDRLLSAVALQVGIALERARLRREATEAEILRRTDELKTELLHAVSHNLRTPLAAIITAAGSLLQEDVPWT